MPFKNIAIPSLDEVDGTTCIAIDFETANERRASPCSIGIAWIDDARILRTAHRLICPRDLSFNGFNISIHGIHPEDVKDEPEFPEIWRELLRHVTGKTVLAHNASFDMSVLRHTLDLYGLSWPEFSYLCTVKIARETWPELPNHKLPTVCKHIGFSLEHHSALSDAEGCATIAIEAARRMGVRRICEFPDCSEISLGQMAPEGYTPCSSPNLKVRKSTHVPIPQSVDAELKDKRFVFTGTLQSMTRAEAKTRAEALGAKVAGSVSKKTDYVVVGADHGSKARKAEELGVETLSEQAWLKLIG